MRVNLLPTAFRNVGKLFGAQAIVQFFIVGQAFEYDFLQVLLVLIRDPCGKVAAVEKSF